MVMMICLLKNLKAEVKDNEKMEKDLMIRTCAQHT